MLGIISQHSWCFCMWYLHAWTLFWKYWSVLERCMVLFQCWCWWVGNVESLFLCRDTNSERGSEMNHAEAVQNEKVLVGACACKAAGKRSGSDLIRVLRWGSLVVCSRFILTWGRRESASKLTGAELETTWVVFRLLRHGRSTSVCSPTCCRAMELLM